MDSTQQNKMQQEEYGENEANKDDTSQILNVNRSHTEIEGEENAGYQEEASCEERNTNSAHLQ